MSLSHLFRRSAAPTPIYLVLMAGQAVCGSLFFTVMLVYQVTVVGLDPLQMVLVGTVMEATCFLFEIPTGVVADVYSRRRSILIGFVLIGGSYLLQGAIPAFWAALAGQVFWGVGYTFTSGATEAWVTDEVGEAVVGSVFLRGQQASLAGGLIGTLLGTALGVVRMQLPLILAGIGMLALTGILTLVMPERRMRPTPVAERSTFGHMRDTAREGFRLAAARPVVRTVVAASLVVGLGSEAVDRLCTPSVIERFAFPTLWGTNSPVFWLGLSGVVGSLIGLAASEMFRRAESRALGAGSPARLLAGFAAVDAAVVLGFALAGNLWLAFAMLWARGVIRTIAGPVQDAWLNRNLDSDTRATAISIASQANSIGQVVGGPALGWVGSAVSLRAALLGSAAVLAPAAALYRRSAVRERAADAPAPAAAD
ncbi:MAG: MFS transporter [Thermomicrobiales bacterium]|nr:MFS transporter [Thermomicrobiales bacterium]